MADKARFARLIDQRFDALDRSAAWLAREVHIFEANISRWRDENRASVTARPRNGPSHRCCA